MVVNVINDTTLHQNNVKINVKMDFNGSVNNKNVDHLHYPNLRINVNIIKDQIYKVGNVRIIVIVQ
jgi:hypothetical protein